ncbi:hypothetical protein [Leisingera sp. JC1]|uniref:hypothetical protein n=1 Tax=Leisingera sp. JC1 TaxID=1855282 RepID=UPI001586C3D2|nr:hypothetical protein [Leisingera sp. JC1]
MTERFEEWSEELEKGRSLDEQTGLDELHEELDAYRRGLTVEEYERERREGTR